LRQQPAKEGIYVVELFAQGKGWKPYHTMFSHTGFVKSFDDALRLGLYAILQKMQESKDASRYGSRVGDVVAMKITAADSGQVQQIPPEAKALDWKEHKHRFFKRGNVFTLYKSWSWPD